MTPWKSFLLIQPNKTTFKFSLKNTGHDLSVSYCSGKAYCSQGILETSQVAKVVTTFLEERFKNRKNKAKIHISGCLKNCGLSKQTSILINSSGGEKSVSVKDKKFQHLASKISMELNK